MCLLLIFKKKDCDIGMLCKSSGQSALWYVSYILYVSYLKIDY